MSDCEYTFRMCALPLAFCSPSPLTNRPNQCVDKRTGHNRTWLVTGGFHESGNDDKEDNHNNCVSSIKRLQSSVIQTPNKKLPLED